MQVITIENIAVRTDAQGRYCLNDLHKAAIANGRATESHRPSEFLSNQGVQAFISALDVSDAENIGKAENPALVKSIKSVKGGKSPGTYAVELVAIRYAAWIDPSFEIRVYRTFQTAARGANDWRKLRSSAASTNKMMNAMLQEVRAAIGKATEPKHYMTEAKLVNWAHSGQFTGMDRDSLSIVELELLAFLEMKNSTLHGRGVPYDERKPLLKQYAMDWRMAHVAAIEPSKQTAKA